MLFHIVFRIWKEIQIEKKIFFLSFTVNTILMFTKQEVQGLFWWQWCNFG